MALVREYPCEPEVSALRGDVVITGQCRIEGTSAIFLSIVFHLENQSPTSRNKGDRIHGYLHPTGKATSAAQVTKELYMVQTARGDFHLRLFRTLIKTSQCAKLKYRISEKLAAKTVQKRKFSSYNLEFKLACVNFATILRPYLINGRNRKRRNAGPEIKLT